MESSRGWSSKCESVKFERRSAKDEGPKIPVQKCTPRPSNFVLPTFLDDGKVLQHPQTHVLALFRMKLSRPDVVASCDGWKRDVVVGCGKNVLAVLGFRIVGVYEVDEAIFGDSFQQRIGTLQVQLVPTNVRH